jgi:DNA polymerase III alpha subunit
MIHLHIHSYFSMLSGTARPRQLIDRAIALGMPALALTDHSGLYGGIEFYKACREAGVKPILGADLEARDGRAVVLARNIDGYTALCRLITAFHEEPDFSLEQGLARDCRNLFILVPDADLLSRLASLNRSADPSLPPFWALVERFDSAQSRNQSRQLIETAHALSVPLVAGNDVHFLEREHYRYHVILRAIGENRTLDPDDLEGEPPAIARLAEREAWFKSPEAMVEIFSDLPQAIEATGRIAAACQLELPLGRIEYPSYPLPGDETAYSWLWKLCFEGARQRYQPLTPRVTQRLNYELSVIEEMHLAAYFLIVWDIVRFCREQRIPCVGRGSAADSLVSYVLGITHGCPIEHDLYFERFLNPERQGAPDIDLDLCWRRRDEVLDYVYRTYSQERVAMIATHATFCARGALRETAKVFGLPEGEINALTRHVPHYGSVKSLEHERDRLPETRGLRFHERLYERLWDAAKFIDGLPRHIGTHACGIVVSPRPLADRAPLQIAPKGLQVTQYEMHAVEAWGCSRSTCWVSVRFR